MKKLAVTSIKGIGFFSVWVLLVAILPLLETEDPAIWRLWAEITPLLAIAATTAIFWLLEKRTVTLHLVDGPAKGTIVGILAGIVWLGLTVFLMYLTKTIGFNGRNTVSKFGIWVLAAFLNVVM